MLAGAVAALLSLQMPSVAQVVWQMATEYPQSAVSGTGLATFGKLVAERTRGAVTTATAFDKTKVPAEAPSMSGGAITAKSAVRLAKSASPNHTPGIDIEPIAQDTPASSICSRSAAGDHPVISDDFCLP